MGYHPHAYLVVGIPAGALVKKVCESETVRKYNEDTGESYDLEIKTWFVEFITGKRIEPEEDEKEIDIHQWVEEFLEYKDPDGLEVFYYSDESESIVGIELARIKTNYYGKINVAHSLADIQAAFRKVSEIFEKRGWNVPMPKIYLTMSG